MKLKALLVAGSLVLAALGLTLTNAQGTTQNQTIAQIVATNPNFSTLLSALKAAGLEETLSGPGPFTVFAPTNAAFAKIPKADLDKLLANKQELTKVLTYHVVAGRVPSSQVVNLKEAKTVEGRSITIEVKDGKVILNGNSTVTTVDIQARNGIIHVIDTVLMPK
ncbi:MAG: fasciclin domain-containing protein [Meiothermus sp.]|uniref:fasciclin domain-containing protein n=1 Tax=Meiothermus sp. TaxID=1955249 RepID=UPI0025FD995B|nr:fasciclin domain-containing protein [Meiothermus sp.]MCS7193359.1 fasciclin domain-containing protein [Meiothermus sp.]MCX7741333.1 fasciclin domain-containing protein [Meiothermus sp.]MDW8480570.1 fasciclin domain-containing protein [Meiothermus sp.]